MSANAAKLIHDSKVLVKYIKEAKFHNGHLTERSGPEDVEKFHILGMVDVDAEGIDCLGHVYGSLVEEIRYKVFFPNEGKPDITILNKVKDKDASLAFLESEISEFKKKYDKKKGGGGGNLKGYYLWSEPPRKPGQATLAQAHAKGLVNDAFIETCKTIKMSMRYYSGQSKKKKATKP